MNKPTTPYGASRVVSTGILDVPRDDASQTEPTARTEVYRVTTTLPPVPRILAPQRKWVPPGPPVDRQIEGDVWIDRDHVVEVKPD